MEHPPSIAFTVRPGESGHLNCAAALAVQLESQGYQVTFVGVADDQEAILSKGFDYHVVAEELFPKGWIAQRRKQPVRYAIELIPKVSKLEEYLSSIANELIGHYDLLIADGHVAWACFVAAEAGIPILLLQTTLSPVNKATPPLWCSDPPAPDGGISSKTHFKMWWKANNPKSTSTRLLFRILGKLAGYDPETGKKLDHMLQTSPSLIACPREFDFPAPVPANEFHIEALIDYSRLNQDGEHGVSSTARLIYASMGSQIWTLRNRALPLFQKIVEAVLREKDWTLILSAGSHAEMLEEKWSHNRIKFLEWAPQMKILQGADVMITHAGLNSVKECIVSEVPMLCFPVGRDQPGNAARVEYHMLGMTKNHKKTSSDEIHRSLKELLSNPTYGLSIATMSEHFKRAEDEKRGVKIVEDILDKAQRHRPRS